MPQQATSPTEVAYVPAPDVVLEIHSHHRYPARFSVLDDADEQRLAVYGVLGRLDTDHPEVRLRVGVYGYFMAVLWTEVFEGELQGFRDVTVEGEGEEGADELST